MWKTMSIHIPRKIRKLRGTRGEVLLAWTSWRLLLDCELESCSLCLNLSISRNRRSSSPAAWVASAHDKPLGMSSTQGHPARHISLPEADTCSSVELLILEPWHLCLLPVLCTPVKPVLQGAVKV